MPILKEIEAFMKARKMSAAAFGLKAMNDKGFVYELREGREIFPRTERKVRNFMLTYNDA